MQKKNTICLTEDEHKLFQAMTRKLKSKQKGNSIAANQPTLAELVLNGRAIVYTNQVPFESDILRSNLYQMTALGQFATTMLATGLSSPVFARGLTCAPISPPGLQVTVGPGTFYEYEALDATQYGVLPADTNSNHQLFKQAINWDPVTLNTPAPSVSGNSVIHLVQVAFQTVDQNVVDRPYFNSADPTDPIFQEAPDTRQDVVSILLKPGVESASPTPPTPDAGYTGLYYVAVTYGQTTISSGNITVVPGAPFITESLTQKISKATADAYYVQPAQLQRSLFTFAVDIGSVNAVVVNPSPAYTGYTYARISVFVAHTNTSAATLNINGLGAVGIVKFASGHYVPLSGGELLSGGTYEFICDGTQFILLNPTQPFIYAQVTFTDSTSQSIPGGGGLYTIAFNQIINDPFSLFNTGASAFVPHITGQYEFSWSVFAQTATDTQSSFLLKNGTIVSGSNKSHPTGQDTVLIGGPIVQSAIANTDVFSIQYQNQDTSSVNIGDHSYDNLFQIRYLGS